MVDVLEPTQHEMPPARASDRSRADPVLTVFRSVMAVFAVAFAAAAWVPAGEPPYGLLAGLAGIATGVVVSSLPVLAFSLAVTARRKPVKLLVGIPLGVIALYAGFICGGMIGMSRDPVWGLH